MVFSAAPKTAQERAPLDPKRVLSEAHDVIAAEGRAIAGLADKVGEPFVQTVSLILACEGRVVVTGLGKSGIVGQKISATLASTGTPSLFLHAAEAVHGDLGRITQQDVVLALSNSGESEEIVRLIRPVRELGAVLVALTGAPESKLARHADITISLGSIAEACPMGLVPTASTTAMMVMGDALAMSLFNHRGLGREEYARFHPGGALGRRFMKVSEVMRSGDENPIARDDMTVREVIAVMTQTPGRPGAAAIVDAAGIMVGFFTDGDLRRLLDGNGFSADRTIADVMHANPKHVLAGHLVEDAAHLMREHKVDQVPVLDEHGKPVGLLDVQDLLATRSI